jgi:protein-S-isoprenylcysteine O-methyltransferase Ste14
MKVLELKIPPVLLFSFFVAAAYGLSRAVPALGWPLPGARVAAAALAFSGAGIAFAGVAEFRKARTTVNPHRPDNSSAVVSGGVYRWTRNPMYLGLLLLLTAWGLYLSHATTALLLPAFVAWMNRFQIEPEERILTKKFGPAFTDYMTCVRRWL